jgi:hypothetical protein
VRKADPPETPAPRGVTGRARAPVSPLARKLDLNCALCGYGIVSRAPPAHCPMCQAVAVWDEQSGRLTRRAAGCERFTG